MYAGTNSFDGSNPHVWYVIACVWGGRRADGSPVGTEKHHYDQPGMFFLNTKEGWVWMPEGAFPGLVGVWMKVYGLAGPGSTEPTHDWGSSPLAKCPFEAAEQLAEADPAGGAFGAACLACRPDVEWGSDCPLPPDSLARGR